MSGHKLKTLKELNAIVGRLKSEGKRIALTNGCFDLIHLGHIRLLQAARERADCLIVALNTDASLRRIKGEKRPLLNEDQRGRILTAFQVVDYVTFFDDDTPQNIIHKIQPDVLVKGGDYEIESVVGRQSVWDSGGEVVVIAPVRGRSTTNIIKEIVARFNH